MIRDIDADNDNNIFECIKWGPVEPPWVYECAHVHVNSPGSAWFAFLSSSKLTKPLLIPQPSPTFRTIKIEESSLIGMTYPSVQSLCLQVMVKIPFQSNLIAYYSQMNSRHCSGIVKKEEEKNKTVARMDY